MDKVEQETGATERSEATLAADLATRAISGRPSPAAAAMPLTVLVAGTLLFALEMLPTVRSVLHLDDFSMGSADRSLVLWTIWSMSLIGLIPSLVLGRLAAWWLGIRWGIALFLVTATIASSLMVADLISYSVFGRHLSQFLVYAATPQPWQVAGDKQEIAGQIVALVLQFTLVTTACFGLCYVVQVKIIERLTWLHNRFVRLIGIVALAMLVFVPLSLHSFAYERGHLERVWIAMPLDLRFDRQAWRNTLMKDPDFAEVDQVVRETYARLFPLMMTPKPADETAVVTASAKPNVIVIVVESLRFDVFQQGWMPRLSDWAERGLILDKHHSGSNCTELGLFGLLYGRSPVVYHTTLKGKISPQMCVSLKNSGYRTALYSSHVKVWRGMEKFANDRTFDEAVFDVDDEWPVCDQNNIDRIRQLVVSSPDQPVFAFAFLMSSHYEYRYPGAYERHTPVNTTHKWSSKPGERVPTKEMREGLLNRYKNSLLFADDLLADLIADLDPERNIIVVTGDHGESFYDDGTYTHANKLSDIQGRTPLLIVGPGFSPHRMQKSTRHADLLPTLLHALNGGPTPVAHCHGRDLLGDVDLPDCLLATNLGRVVISDGDLRFKCLIPFQNAEPRGQFETMQNTLGDPITPKGAIDPDRFRTVFEYELWLATQ